ncbi:MAG: PaaI family thioesterase [Paracoccaceae bacterium]|nr:PaaI family thioesterase [Paracoccaceae bacterium]MDG1371853.1 PaaI family thioesterase [Paracoccaceae bacterium]
MTDTITAAEVEAFYIDQFAPWVKALAIKVETANGPKSTYRLPMSQDLVRGGGTPVLSGQAISAAADTVTVLALMSANGRYRNCTTVDMTVHFMRPIVDADVIFEAEVLSNGRRMATTRITGRADGSPKPAISATLAFAYLED